MEYHGITLPRPQQNTLRHISDLPVEILSHILFSLISNLSGVESMIPLRCPALQVCHLWRECGLAMPRIWTTLVFPRQSMFVKPFLEEILPRAGKLPVSLTTHAHESHMVREFREVVGKISTRLHTLNIELDCFDWPKLFPLPGEFPLLDTFNFEVRNLVAQVEIPCAVFRREAHLPKLRRATIHARSFNFTFGLDVFMPKLTHLHLSHMDYSAIHDLDLYENLQDLQWNTDFYSVAASHNSPRVALPRLKSLKTSLGSLAISFVHIETPALTHVDIMTPAHPPYHHVNTDQKGLWRRLIANGRLSTIKCLTLDGNTWLNREVIYHLPALVELHLPTGGWNKISRTLLLLADQRHAPAVPCPNLSKLTFSSGLPLRAESRKVASRELTQNFVSFSRRRSAVSCVALIVIAPRIMRRRLEDIDGLDGQGCVQLCFQCVS